jgi:hypothetical protein
MQWKVHYNKLADRHWWLTPVILPIQEAGVRRIAV